MRCPKGHELILHEQSLLFDDCYYCKLCDKIYAQRLSEITKEWFNRNFNSPRFEEIKRSCLIEEAISKVTEKDLIKLGYLK